MDQFEKEMIAQSVPMEAIQKFKNSPYWVSEFRRYTPYQVESIVYLFPKIYHTLTERPFVATAEELVKASKQYLPMDMTE